MVCGPLFRLSGRGSRARPQPAGGPRPRRRRDFPRVLGQLRDEGLGILLVEHDMDFVMRLTNHLVVMDLGAKLAEGPPADIQRNPAVLEAYLGGLDDSDPLAAAPVSTVTPREQP